MRTIRRRILAALLTLTGVIVAVAAPPSPAGAAEPYEFDDVVQLPGLTDGHARVLRLYEAAFDRDPDAGGSYFWINRFDQCWTLDRIATHFSVSTEFIETYGPSLSDEEFVDVIYTNVLDRAPDAGGRAFWTEQLATGARTRARVMLDFSWSDEFTEGLPYPFDGVPDLPCDETRVDRPLPGADGGITIADLATMTMPVNTCPADSAMAIRAGREGRAVGDINGDGLTDAIVIVECRGDGMVFEQKLVVWYAGGDPFLVTVDDTEATGAVEVSFNRVSIWFNTVRLDWLGKTADDPNCCPSISVKGVYELDGSVLFLIGGTGESPRIAGSMIVQALNDGDRSPVVERISQVDFDAVRAMMTGGITLDLSEAATACTYEAGFYVCRYPSTDLFELQLVLTKPTFDGLWIVHDLAIVV